MNDGDQAVHLIYLFGCILLVVSALTVRRLPIGQTLKMVLAWVLIFGATFAVFSLRDEFAALWNRLVLEARGGAETQAVGGELRIRQSPDGHFWVDAEVNGEPIRFLVDSGATTTSLSRGAAARAGIAISPGFGAVVQTANGMVTVDRGRAERLKIGPIERSDVAVHVSEAFGEMNVIGMNVLSSLSGWSVEGRTLVLRP